MILASTESVRQAFSSREGGNVKQFTPQLTLNLGIRVSHVVFTADEEYLVIAAEQGGGLAVYEVKALMQGNTNSTFQLSTNNTSLRALVPNPTPEKAELVAVVTSNGVLMMANLQTREFSTGTQGQVMKEGVSCLSWSNKGKQLVAGLADGTLYQMTPEGQGKAEIPRPLDLEGDNHGRFILSGHLLLSLTSIVSSVLWLENHVFLVAHVPTSSDNSQAPSTTFHVITRQQNQSTFTFQKLPELCAPFGMNRSPPYHFLQRLKDFPPNVQDIILVASTAADDVGIFSRSAIPLSSDFPAEKISNVFTTTTMANDSRRAQTPMPEEGFDSTSPIGTALDLSAKEKVPRPLPGEEMDYSPGPLPALMLLNNEGILASWWIVYAESIRKGTTYPGLSTEINQSEVQQQSSQPTPATTITTTPSTPAFGQAALGVASSGGTLGASSNTSGSSFGVGNVPSTTGASSFGQPSGFGNTKSPWTNTSLTSGAPQSQTPAFGKPSFGSMTTMGASTQGLAFGSTGGLGKSASPWGAPSAGASQTGGSAFGQPSGLGMRSGSAFGALPTTNPFGSTDASKSPFGNFAQGAGFAAAAAKAGGESPFAKAGTGALFASTMDTDTSFGGTPQKKNEPSGLFSTNAFKLGSTFTNDGSTKMDSPKPSRQPGFGFGTTFGGALDEARDRVATPQSKEADMEDDDDGMALKDSRSSSASMLEETDETKKPTQSNNEVSDSAPPEVGGFFGTQSQEKTTPAAVQQSTPAPSIFGKPTPTADAKQLTQPAGTQPPKVGGLFGTQAQDQTTPAAVQTSAPASSTFNKLTSTTTPSSTPKKLSDTPQSSVTPPSPQIKGEPEDVETPAGVSKSIPEAPLPPESTSKTAYAPGDSSNSSKSSSDDAPLPPDWTPARSKLKNEEKPPSEGSASPEDAPLPPDFIMPKSKPKQPQPATEETSALPAEDDDEAWDDEGSGVDVAQEMSPTTDPNQSLGITPESSFGASFERSPLGGMFSKVPRQPPRQPVKTLFGETGQPNAPLLPPPSRTKESPRSPSPVRLVPPELLRPDNARSVSAPGRAPNFMASRKPGASKPTSTLRNQPTVQQQRQRDLEVAIAQRTKRQEEEEQDLSDGEDERVREELEMELEGTKTLDDFIAHQDYVGGVTKPGIPGQIEKVYRDINSMVDTLGLNARSLSAFVKGHSELAKDGGRSMEDLDDEDWCLIEIADLEPLEKKLAGRLQKGRTQDIQPTLDVCRDLRKELAKLGAKRAEIARFVETKSDPEQVEALRAAPLNEDYAAQQHKLRKKFTDVQKLIAEVEGNITMLRTSLVARDPSKSKDSSLKKPTVEAVTNTILKMTSMIEKKSGDIDVLENQMRKLRFSTTNPLSHREASPSIPDTSTDQISGMMNATSLASGVVDSPGSAFRRSTGDRGTPRKRMSTITPDDVSRLTAKIKRRREVSRMVQEAFLRTGPKVSTLE